MNEEAKNQENAEVTADQQAEDKTEATPAAAEATQETTEAPAEKPAEEPKAQLSEKMEGLIKTVEEMSVLELSDLVKALEDRFGVSAAAPVAFAGGMMPGAGGAAGGAEAEEKTIFDVVLADVGAQKIQVIKEIRALTSLGLKEAKDLVEAAPKEVKTGLTKDDADKMKAQLEAAGAKIELK